MYKNKYLRNFSTSIPRTSYGPTRDTTDDPLFDLESKTPYMDEIVTRATVFDYFRTSLLLPNPSVVLQKIGKNIEEFDQLMADARVKACYANRRAGTLSLKWTIDQNDSPDELYDLCERIFDTYPLYDIMSELLLASFYGYSVAEVNWVAEDGLYIPKSVIGKATRWLAWDEENQLRFKTKVQMTQGEPLPPRKIIVCKYNPTYQDPYSGNECLAGALYWPVKFRHMTLQSAEIFVKRYAMPWLDAKMDANVLKADRVTELMKALKAGSDDNVFIHPGTTEVTLLNTSDTKSVENYTKYLDMLNREIDMVILGTNMGAEIKGGSFAAASAMQGVRDDVIQSDVRMIENAWNTLIEWISWYNFPSDVLPKFTMYKDAPPTKERAEIDVMTSKLGVKLNKTYFARTYGYNENEFEIEQPVQELAPGVKGDVTGAEETAVTEKKARPKIAAAGQIQSTGMEAKEPAINKSTTESIIKNQQRGYSYSEGEKPIMYFVRHGGTNLNGNSNDDRIRSWNNVQLNRAGVKQGQELGKALFGKIDLIVSSDLDRAADTADAIAAETKSPVVKTKALRPWNLGIYIGQHSKDIQGKLKEYVDNPDTEVPEGESFNAFRTRFMTYYTGLETTYPGKRVALIAHHRNDRLLSAWDKAGRQPNFTVDKETFLKRGQLEPGQSRVL